MRFNTHQFLARAIVAVCLAAPIVGKADDEIRAYTVPKETPAVAQTTSAMPAADIPVSSARISWTTPVTWEELKPTSIRIGNFLIHGEGDAKAEMAIFSFPGSVGTEIDNVNRWRNELKMPPIEAGQIMSEPVMADSSPGKMYEFISDTTATVVAGVPHNGDTWYFKMKGDKDVVTEAEPVFRDFLKTVRFNSAVGGSQPTDASPEGAAPPASNPHGDLTGAIPPASASPETASKNDAEPKWNVPGNWVEKKPGPMVFKTFRVSNDQGKTANVSVSVFPDKVGGTFLNVNRWRAQMTLPPIEENQLAGVTHSLDTAGGKATLVDFTGTDSRTTQPARMVAIEVPHDGDTWFYKLLGDGEVVAAEKEKFIKFVQDVRYP